MINTLGTNNLVIVDSDALIGLMSENDLLHQQCVNIADHIDRNDFITIVCYSTILEASTTLSRAVNRPYFAKKLLKDFSKLQQPEFSEVGASEIVAKTFDPKSSKKNTPFDHYVLAVAKLNNIELVFSFDSFYERHGLKLMKNVIDF